MSELDECVSRLFARAQEAQRAVRVRRFVGVFTLGGVQDVWWRGKRFALRVWDARPGGFDREMRRTDVDLHWRGRAR